MTQPTPDESVSPRSSGTVRARPDRDQALADRDRDLADHDLSDHDEALFHGPSNPWRHVTSTGIVLLLVSLVLAGGAVWHLNDMSANAIGNAATLPIGTPTPVGLEAGEQRMLYTQRGSGTTRCDITDPSGAPVSAERTSPVILQGSDVLWHGQSLFTAAEAGDYTIRCQGSAEARVGSPVGTLDVVLTVVGAGLGGLGALAALVLLWWGRARRRAQA